MLLDLMALMRARASATAHFGQFMHLIDLATQCQVVLIGHALLRKAKKPETESSSGKAACGAYEGRTTMSMRWWMLLPDAPSRAPAFRDSGNPLIGKCAVRPAYESVGTLSIVRKTAIRLYRQLRGQETRRQS